MAAPLQPPCHETDRVVLCSRCPEVDPVTRMPSSSTSAIGTRALRAVAQRARLAPSVHNTQPWRFEIAPGTFTLRVDRTRQLRVLDPTGRQMIISAGCALF